MRLKARMIGSHFTSPRPGETKSQPRRGSPKSRWEPRMLLRPVSLTRESLTWQWKMREGKAEMNSTGSTNWWMKWLGAKLKPKGGGGPTAASPPSRAACKPVHHVHPEKLRGLRGVLHFLSAALAHALGLPIAPQPRRQDGFVA